MKRKLIKLSTLALSLLTAASLAVPASARTVWYNWNWQPKMNVIQASGSAPSWKPSSPSTTPSTSTSPSTPSTSTSSPSSATSSVSALERQVVELVNQRRAAYGLGALTLSSTLSNGARLKAQDLQKNRYFDHNSPTYGSPFDMMRSLGIQYGSAGENIAMGYSSASAVVEAWMNSPSHRANILNARYTKIGVGYVANGGYWAQWFTN